MWRVALLGLLLGALVASCSQNNSLSPDVSSFVLPDSGYIYDSGPDVVDIPDTGVGDTGPHVCNPGCAADEVCGCLRGRGAPVCGCHEPGAYAMACDPQVQDTCRHPFRCVRGRTSAGSTYLCSDGRVGTPCSRDELFCNSNPGCVCRSTPFGTSCTCEGEQGPDSRLCDPMVPATCPNGTCVRVEGQLNPFWICSDGGPEEPCNPGDGSCRTSLGCTCPLVAGRLSCRCSEPGTMNGDACDPMVQGSCVAPLMCNVRGNPAMDGFFTECVGQMTPGNGDPFSCDPNMPLCPMGFSCQDDGTGVFRCRP